MQMMLRSLRLMLALLLALVLAPVAALAQADTAPTLKWGDSAPPFKVVKWLKGTPVERFEPGKTYVLEFWATWCGPCKAAMPHLSELAKKYDGKVTFVGVDVWENGADPMPAVEQFVKDQGDLMAYNVAADEPGRKGFMAVNWLDASKAQGIPATFVVHDGKVVWTGHPDHVEPVLEQVVNKTYDLAATLKKQQDEDAVNGRINAVVNGVIEKLKAKDYAGVVALAESDDARLLPDRARDHVQRCKLSALLHVDEGKARDFAREIAKTSDNAIQMQRMMGLIIAGVGDEPDVKLSKETFALGAEMMENAFKAAPGFTGNPDFDLGRAANYFGAGDPAKALALTVNAAKNNGDATGEYGAKRAPKIEALAKKYAAAAGVAAPVETTAEAQLAAQKKNAEERAAAEGKKVYDESADAKQQIATAIANAKKSNRRVLIQWGGNWCTWCLRLHEMMAADKDITAALQKNYEVVLIDTAKPAGKNMDLLASYGVDTKKVGFPHLTVLDADGKVMVNQETGAFEIGSIEQGHSPKKVLAFLNQYAVGGSVSAQAGVAVAAPAATAGEGQVVQLKPINSGARDKLSGYVPIRAELVNEKPSTIKKLPDGLVSPVFGELQLVGRAGAHYHVVFDIPKGKEPRLFADANGDGDLTNDPPAEWKQSRKAEGKKASLYEGGATFDLGTDDKPRAVHLNMYCMGDDYDTVYRSPDYATEGQLALDGKTYAVMLNDSGCTGDFSGAGIDPEDSFAVRPQFLIDLDGDGKFASKGESVNVNKPVAIAGKNFNVADIAKDGTSFKLVPAPEAAEAQQASEQTQPSPIREGRTRRANAVGQPFELTFTDAVTGKPVDVRKDFKGKIVVLDFWATWCHPCVEEMPHNKELSTKFKDKGVAFIGISLDNPEDKGGLTALKKYVAQNGIDWPQYLIQGSGGDKLFATKWGVSTIPAVFVVDADGKLHSTDARGKLDEMIPELINKRDGGARSAGAN